MEIMITAEATAVMTANYVDDSNSGSGDDVIDDSGDGGDGDIIWDDNGDWSEE